MTDKTDLIELTDSEERMVSIIWQAFPEYFDGAVEGQNYGDSEKLTRLARELSKHLIESDEAREYWRGQDYDIQQRAVQLAVLVERTRFVEQACEAIDESKASLENPEALIGFGHDMAKKAIRDRFNAASD